MAFRPDRLREIREKRKMLQRDLGVLCGLNVNQISRYEQGVSEPSTEMLARLSYHLGITADYLIGLSDDPQGLEKNDLRDDERDLLEAYTTGDSTTMLMLMYERLQKLGKSPQRHET